MSDSTEPDKKNRDPKPLGEIEDTADPTTDSSDLEDEIGGHTGFDYSAFEESLADLAPEEPDLETDPGVAPEMTHSRVTLDTQHVPKDDATSSTRDLGQYTIVTIRGRINESFSGAELGEKLRGRVIFDLTEVDRITSFGVRAWLQMLDASRLKEAVFYRASPAVVNQITMMRNFCGPASIHSLVAPYGCPSCGAEFGVPYDAVEDRAILKARNPVKVACPQCNASSEMDEDPWVFFAVDEQLLEVVSPDLDRVLNNMGETQRHAPIEKTIMGDVTRIRFNDVVDGDTRFQRAFSGMEGRVAVDLRTATSVAPAGTEGLKAQLMRLDADVKSLDIEGAPLDLLEHILDNPDPRVRVLSVATSVSSLARPLERRIVVDLKRERAALRTGQPLDVDVPWRDDPLNVEGMPLLQRAASTFDFGERTTAAVSFHGTPAPAQTKTPALASQGAPRRPQQRTNPLLYAALGALLFLLILAGGTLAWVFTQPRAGGAEDPDNINTQAKLPPPAPPAPDEWSSGGSMPPAWSELSVKQEADTWLIVGHGDAESSAGALKRAREDATAALLEAIRPQIPQHFEDEQLPQAGPERASALQAFQLATSSLTMERKQQASFQKDGEHQVVVQYELPVADLDALLADYSAVQDFKGMRVVQSAPWAKAGLRLLQRASFVKNAKAGDRLVKVADQPVNTLAEFRTITQSSMAALAPGTSFSLTFDRDGSPVATTVTKRAAAVAPPRPKIEDRPNRPELFRKKDP